MPVGFLGKTYYASTLKRVDPNLVKACLIAILLNHSKIPSKDVKEFNSIDVLITILFRGFPESPLKGMKGD